jgi:hypothetical protein
MLASFPEALYGKGLLRFRSGKIYSRIMAVRETVQTKQFMIGLGKMIASSGSNPQPPKIVLALPRALNTHWILNRKKSAYFYSHLVLNSCYYLSHDNILVLDHSCEAVVAPYERIATGRLLSRIYLLTVRYPNPRRAIEGLNQFMSTYLPDSSEDATSKNGIHKEGIFKIEDGWLGFKLQNRMLTLVFEIPELTVAQRIIDQLSVNMFQ